MRYLVAPEFSNKLSSLTVDGLATMGTIVKFLEKNDKEAIIAGILGFDVNALDKEIYIAKYGNYRFYLTFGDDDKGEYLLLLDIAVEENKATAHPQYFSTKNPNSNRLLNPNTNQLIDPRRNMMIDPNRNMMIDPNRNMMIDPHRNMMIDPNRNMMIDPQRNMMIDPRRNMMIDPNRNMMIDPRRNRFYGGPYSYTTKLQQCGFLVRANDEITLFFDMSASFKEFGVKTKHGNVNIFDTSRNWVGFLVPTGQDVLLRFDTRNNWIGFVV